MKKHFIVSFIFMGSLAALSTPSAFAYEAGDWVVKVGAATVDPKEASDDIDQVPGQTVNADHNTQVGISATYMVNDQIGIEVLAATPFTHEIEGREGLLDGASIGDIKHLPPTVSALYYPAGTSNKVKPYVGLGVNYTVFFDEETGSDAKGLGYNELSLDDSAGLTAQIGVDYDINKKVFINASAMYADIDTKATLKGPGQPDLTVNYDLDPVVYRVNIGTKF